MGRGRGGATKAAKDSGNTRAVEKASRATRGARKSYVEDEGSEEEFKDDVATSPEDVGGDSGSEFDAESSGSEYGKKKKKGKVSPKKVPAKRGRKPAGKAQLSPKKRGRKPKSAAVAASSNGKRKRASESSDEEEDKISSEEVSEDDVSASGDTSGSEYGKKKSNKKLKKEKPPTRSQPKRQAAPSPKKRGRKPKETTNGNKKAKLNEIAEENNSEDEMETDEPEKKKSDEEGDATTEDEVKESESTSASEKKKLTAKAEDLEDDDDNDDKTEEVDSPKSEEADEKDVSDEDPEDAKVDTAAKKKDKTVSSGSKPDTALLNRTDTDFESLDLTCDKKTPSGEAWNFKIACWNVAGIKAWIKKNGLEYLKRENPDIMCLQETKCSEKTKPAEMKSVPNYPHTFWCYAEEANGHNGVATLCKIKPESVSNGIPIGDDDSDEDKKLKRSFNKEGRLIVTEFEKFYLLNAYVPNGGRGVKDDKHPKGYPPRVTNGERQSWDRLFREYVKTLEEKKPVIVTGDLNVAHEPIDLANPKTNTNAAGFTQEERDGFTEMLGSTKLVDSFRSLYPEEQAYTFWTYMGNARGRNVGWRLDYFLTSEKLQDSLADSTIRKDVYGSDHCPIVLFVHL